MWLPLVTKQKNYVHLGEKPSKHQNMFKSLPRIAKLSNIILKLLKMC